MLFSVLKTQQETSIKITQVYYEACAQDNI